MKKRQRHAHDWQTKLPTQESFVVDKGGSLKHSEWSQFEKTVFILLLQQMKDCIDEQPPKSILTTFNRIVELSRTPQCKVSLPQDAVLHEKRLNQITGKLKHYKAECELFIKLLKV